MKRAVAVWLAAMAVTGALPARAADTELSVFAAGRLRAVLTDAGRAFESGNAGVRVRFTFGASGLLKDRLAGGDRADLFASANMAHPQALADAGLAQPVQRFARNALCALVAAGEPATTQNLVTRMLDPAVRLGTSTPKADPAGDYAFQMFERVEHGGVIGANRRLADKALQLTGGPNSPVPPPGRSVYAELVANGQADIFITYCTGVVTALQERPALRRVDLPADINVSADYGVTVLNGAPAEAQALLRFLLGEAGQALLVRHGFSRR